MDWVQVFRRVWRAGCNADLFYLAFAKARRGVQGGAGCVGSSTRLPFGRDYLRNHKPATDEYGKLKQRLAA